MPAAGTRTAGSGTRVARDMCLIDSWFQAPVLKGRPVSVVEISHTAGDWSQHTLQNSSRTQPCPEPITRTGRVGVLEGRLPCWLLLLHSAKIGSGLQAASPQFLLPVPPVSPVQRSREFVLARVQYTSSQKPSLFSLQAA